MGLYEVVSKDRGSPGLPWVAQAKSYTLYERGKGIWYVNFVADGRQVRLSTGCSDEESARALVESYRTGPRGPTVKVNRKHVHRMIERARTRAKRKGKGAIPFALSLETVMAAVERCNGYCEVTGHPLEDSGPFRPSLDRIDCNQGYVPENIRIVCLITNTAMLHYGESALAEMAISYCRKAGLLGSTEAGAC